MENNNKKDLSAEVYADRRRFHTIAMITDSGADGIANLDVKNDANTGKNTKKCEGMLFVAPMLRVSAKIKLKARELVFAGVNTSKSQDAITALAGDNNRKYITELGELFDNLESKLTNLKSDKYKDEDKKYVLEYLQSIRHGIGIGKNGDEINLVNDKIASGIYKSDGKGVDLPGTVERGSQGKCECWAMAFDGWKDFDREDLITDDKINPVHTFYDMTNTNGAGLKSLIGSNRFQIFNTALKTKLGDKDFSRGMQLDDKPSYAFFPSYFIPGLLELIAIDNRNNLLGVDFASIANNWNKLLYELLDPNQKDIFNDYEPDGEGNYDCPINFTKFLLDKLLGAELLEKLQINNDETYKKYANGAATISSLLANADHANQLVAMEFNGTLKNLTYDNSIFIAQDDFVFAPLYNLHQGLNYGTKNKLKLLAYGLKDKKIQLDQTGMTTSTEYKFGRMQELERGKDGNVASIKYKVSNFYDTDVSAEELMELVLKIRDLKKTIPNQIRDVARNFGKNNKGNNENNINEKNNVDSAESFLNMLIEARKIDTLSEDNIKLIIGNKELMDTILTFVSNKHCDNVYQDIYAWFINKPKAMELMQVKYLIPELLADNNVLRFFNKQYGINEDELAKFLLLFSKRKALNKLNQNLVAKITKTVIGKMFEQDQDEANKIITKFVHEFTWQQIGKINLGNEKLSNDAINEIFYYRHKNLSQNQIASIDCSKLKDVCIKILFNEHLQAVSQHNVDTLSDDALKKLMPLQILKLMQIKSYNKKLDFQKHKDWLQSLSFDDLVKHLNLKNKNAVEAFVDFVAAHINFFSETQILSLSKYVFTQCKEKNKDYAGKVDQILNKIDEKVGNSPVCKAFVGIKSINIDNDPICFRKLLAILILIHQNDPTILAQLFRYFIDTNKYSCSYLDNLFSAIINYDTETMTSNDKNGDNPTTFEIYKDICAKLNADKEIDNPPKNNMSDFLNTCQGIYETIKGKNPGLKSFSEPSLENTKKGISEIKSVFNDTLKQPVKLDKNKGKNEVKLINKLDLENLPQTLDCLMSSDELFNLLSDTQINQIDLGDATLTLKNTKVLFEKLGHKFSFMQLQNLVSSFNSLNANTKKQINGKTVHSLDFYCFYTLSKIVTASNTISGKEKKFADKYRQLGNDLESIIDKFNNDCILRIAAIKHVEDNQQQGQYYLAHGYNSAADKVVVDDVNKESENLKLDSETLKKLKNSVNEFTEQVGTAISNKSDLSSLEEKAEQIKNNIKKFNQEYQRCKSNFFGKFKANFSAAVGSLDMKKVRECLNAVYDWNGKTKAERDKELENENYDENDFIELVNLDNENAKFKKCFIDDFIELKLEGTKDNNFCENQRRNLGIVNIVDDVQAQAQSGENILVQHTPEYILNNLPLILENCHCNEYDLDKVMYEFGLDNLILKFDKNTGKKKKSLESFIDDEKLVLLDHDNCFYFKAVKKLFWDHADNIWENTDLEFERKNDDQNKFGQPTSNGAKLNGKLSINKAKQVQNELHSDLKYCTQQMGIFQPEKGNVCEQIVGCFDKKTIVDKLNSMDYKKCERFMFLCGDWICASKKFRAQKNFLGEFRDIVMGRLDFGCRDNMGRYNEHERNGEKSIIPKGIGNDVCNLNGEAYNLLAACTLLSGLNQSIENERRKSLQARNEEIIKITRDLIPEICQLIVGKDRNFSKEDMDLIFKCCALMEEDKKKLSPITIAVANHVISCQNNRETLKSVIKNLKAKEVSNEDKICILECAANNNGKVDFMEVIQVISETDFYPDYGQKFYSCVNDELSFEFIKGLMEQIIEKYTPSTYPDDQQKEALKKFFGAFVISDGVFEKNGAEVANLFKELMKKVSPDKLQDVTEKIINICTGLKWPNQRAKILKYILDASNHSLQGLDLLKTLKECDYTKILRKEYVFDGKQNVEQEFTQLDSDFVEKIISDILKKSSKLTQEEVKQLEYFCTTCMNINGADKNKTDNYLFLFSQLIQKIPSGSMSRNMFSGLVCNIFPNLLEDLGKSKDIKKLKLNKLDIKTAKALAYGLSESEYVLKDYMPDPSCKKNNKYGKYQGEKTYSFEPEDFFNSLSSDDLKNKNIRALVYSVYRDFNLKKICMSKDTDRMNNRETLESYDSVFYDLISKFPYNTIYEDEFEQLISIGIIEPENLKFKSEWVGDVELVSRWYSIDCRKLLRMLAVVESDSINKFTILMDKIKSEQSSVDEVDKARTKKIDWMAVIDKKNEMTKKRTNFEIAGENWNFDDFIHLINYPQLAQELFKIAYDKEKIPNLGDFYSNLYDEYHQYAGRIAELEKEMAKLPVLVSRDFRITNDFYSNLNLFFFSAVFSKKYDDLKSCYISVLSYYLLRMYFGFSEGKSIQDKFSKLNLPKDKVQLTEDGSLEISLDGGKMIFQGFSEVDLAKEKLILISRSKSFINKDFIRSIKFLNEQEKEKKSLCLGVKYEDQSDWHRIQKEKQMLFSFGEDDDVKTKLKNREQLIDYVIDNFEGLFLKDEEGSNNFDIVISFLFELDRNWLTKAGIVGSNIAVIDKFDTDYVEQLSRLINKLFDYITPDNNVAAIINMIKKLNEVQTHANKFRFVLPMNFNQLIQKLENKCSELDKEKRVLVEEEKQNKEELGQKKIKKQQEIDKKNGSNNLNNIQTDNNNKNVIQSVNNSDDNERQQKLKRIQEPLELGLGQGQKKEKEGEDKNNTGNNKQDKNETKNDNPMKPQKIINNENKIETVKKKSIDADLKIENQNTGANNTNNEEEEKKKQDKLNKNNKYKDNDLVQKLLDTSLGQNKNSGNNGEKNQFVPINPKGSSEQQTEQKQSNDYTPKSAGIYATLAAISVFLPPVFGIGLFILKLKDPKYKITGKDVVLILIYSLPIVAPIAGFIMDYKASQESQEMEVKNLTKGDSKNNDKTTINDKINNINQNQQVKNIDNEIKQSILNNKEEK